MRTNAEIKDTLYDLWMKVYNATVKKFNLKKTGDARPTGFMGLDDASALFDAKAADDASFDLIRSKESLVNNIAVIFYILIESYIIGSNKYYKDPTIKLSCGYNPTFYVCDYVQGNNKYAITMSFKAPSVDDSYITEIWLLLDEAQVQELFYDTFSNEGLLNLNKSTIKIYFHDNKTGWNGADNSAIYTDQPLKELPSLIADTLLK